MNLPPNPREIMDQVTNTAALGAVTAPLVWWDWFVSVSNFFAVATPILGGIWFLVQIWAKVKSTRKQGNNNE